MLFNCEVETRTVKTAICEVQLKVDKSSIGPSKVLQLALVLVAFKVSKLLYLFHAVYCYISVVLRRR